MEILERSGRSAEPSPHRLLHIYLTDHRAGAAGGLALVRRCRESNAGTPLADALAEIEREIDHDRATLERIIADHGAGISLFKAGMAKVGVALGRLKLNGRLVRYSPLSRVFELEALSGGIVMKGKLWVSLREIAGGDPLLDVAELDELIARATRQFDQVAELHRAAAASAFGSNHSERAP